mgnify:CR=1 FL=1
MEVLRLCLEQITCALVYFSYAQQDHKLNENGINNGERRMIFVFLVNSLIVALAVLVHYEFLYRLAHSIPKINVRHRFKLLIAVFGTFIAHVIEIWLFAIAYYYMHKAEGWGELSGNFTGSLLDCGYFSFTVYSTVGFGDIEPMGSIRYLTGIESLTGLMLIAWSASFLYLEMQRQWAVKPS